MESEDKVAQQENGEVESMDEAAAGDAENDDAEVQGSQSEQEDNDEVQEKPKLGLLDQPLVLDGRRKKHSVQRLQLLSPDREKKKLEVEEGKGTPLGQIDGIEQSFQKNKGDELKIIHRLAFGRPGQSYEVKKNLRLFSGFSFDKTDEQYERKRVSLAKYPIEIVRQTCDQLCLSRSGRKDDLVDRVMEFLLKPTKKSTKPLATGGRKTSPSKRKQRSSGSTSKSPRKRSKEIADTDDDTDDEDESPKKKKMMKEGSPAKKPGRTPVKTKEVKPSGSAKRKQGTPKKTIKVTTVASDSDSSDDEPLSKKFSTFPSDEDLVASCKGLLAKADLDSVTVKSICLKVYEKYADQDLSSKKDFLKKTIKELYENMV